jgi:hypothetical protein
VICKEGLLLAGLAVVSILRGQDGSAAARNGTWTTKAIELKYLDPEDLRRVFSSQSYVMQVNRDLKLLIVTGPQSFVKEVEDLGSRLDVTPPIPTNLQITVYLLANTGQPTCADPLPSDIASLKGELAAGSKAATLQLVDTQFLRVRAGQPGQAGVASSSACTPSLGGVSLQSAWLNSDGKEKTISLNGLQVAVNKAASPDPTHATAAKGDSDIKISVDVSPDKPAVIARSGIDAPVTVVVRAKILP